MNEVQETVTGWMRRKKMKKEREKRKREGGKNLVSQINQREILKANKRSGCRRHCMVSTEEKDGIAIQTKEQEGESRSAEWRTKNPQEI